MNTNMNSKRNRRSGGYSDSASDKNNINTPTPVLAAALLAAVLLLTGCSALRVMNPFDSVTAADAEWKGIKSGDVKGITPALVSGVSPESSVWTKLLPLLLDSDPLGVIMPLTMVGHTEPRLVLCLDKYKSKCEQIPLNAEVSFSGKLDGYIWVPTRLSAENFND